MDWYCNSFLGITSPLRWRHNERDGVSDHRRLDCVLNGLFRRRSKKTSKFRVIGLCEGNLPGPVNSPHIGPVTRNFLHLMTSSCNGMVSRSNLLNRPRPCWWNCNIFANKPWVSFVRLSRIFLRFPSIFGHHEWSWNYFDAICSECPLIYSTAALMNKMYCTETWHSEYRWHEANIHSKATFKGTRFGKRNSYHFLQWFIFPEYIYGISYTNAI